MSIRRRSYTFLCTISSLKAHQILHLFSSLVWARNVMRSMNGGHWTCHLCEEILVRALAGSSQFFSIAGCAWSLAPSLKIQVRPANRWRTRRTTFLDDDARAADRGIVAREGPPSHPPFKIMRFRQTVCLSKNHSTWKYQGTVEMLQHRSSGGGFCRPGGWDPRDIVHIVPTQTNCVTESMHHCPRKIKISCRFGVCVGDLIPRRRHDFPFFMRDSVWMDSWACRKMRALSKLSP